MNWDWAGVELQQAGDGMGRGKKEWERMKTDGKGWDGKAKEKNWKGRDEKGRKMVEREGKRCKGMGKVGKGREWVG